MATLAEQIKERYQLYRVNHDGYNIAGIKDPSEKVQMAAIKKDLGNITLIDSPCEAVQIYVAERDPFSVSLYQSSETAQMVAIEHDPTVIVHIDNPSSDLCKAAVEKAFPGVAIDYPFTPVETQSLIEKIKDIEIAEERIKIFEEFKNDIATEKSVRIEAIQILEGNAPERIFEEKFVLVRNQFPFEEKQLNESINDIESGIKYSEPRMLSDNHFKKIEIQGSAQYFANQIKKDLTPEELLTFSKELESPLNLPFGKTPTAEEALSLFLNEYGDRVHSALYENEKTGRYEVHKPTIEYGYKSEELLHAGTHPYSPNYKEVFEKAGVANEFKAFEKACCERVQWNHSYNYAIATRDIAELNDLERKLPILNEKVESSRSLVYSKLNDLYFNLEANKVKATSNLTPEETKRLLEIKSTHSISYNDEDFLKKYNFSAEKSEFDELRDERKNGLVDYGKQYMNEAKTRMRAGFILEENGIISKGTTIRELLEEGWRHEGIKEIHTNLVNEVVSSGNSISSIRGRSKTEAELGVQFNKLSILAGDNPQRYERISQAYQSVMSNIRSHGYGTTHETTVFSPISAEERQKPYVKEPQASSTLSKANITQELQKLSSNYKDLGYTSIADAISYYIPNYANISESGSSFSYTIENVEVSSGGAKVLYGDIIVSKGSGEAAASIANYRVKDKTTGLIEALETNGVDICKQPANQVKKLLSGSKVQTSSAATGITQMLGLNKTPLGWGISIGKQIFNSAESSAGIG